MNEGQIPVDFSDPINAKILAVSEDRLQGFQQDPIGAIVRESGVEVPVVIERIRAMLRAGTIRRVRQTLLATNLAKGALVAWKVPTEKMDSAFNYLFEEDPFSGHVVTRTTDTVSAGSNYKLWTTLKVPQGYSMKKHSEWLLRKIGGDHFRLMPAKRLFALGVGHVRRRGMPPGSRADQPAEAMQVAIVDLTAEEWRVMTAVKREFKPEEIIEDIWTVRAAEAGVSLDEFFRIAKDLDRRRVVGRFSTFLEHVKRHSSGERVTKFNALFHWAVPEGREIEAGGEVGRHDIMTHAYWREGGPDFHNVNIMGVAHGTNKELVLEHKAAIDKHLQDIGIPVSYTNVFWGGRSEIKPSEISPIAYQEWCQKVGINPEDMHE
ncbi:MAG: Lrp/AsnC family transcriptional regulator [Verrucomicrobiota bacterium]|nr:Lrp/AsnC family transcriptional regulator [Verrucomicrobiota bacterium]